LIQLFLIGTPTNLSEIQKAIDDNDGQSLSRAAHAFMSTTGYFPQSGDNELLKNLESTGRNNRLDEAAKTYVQLSRQINRFTDSLKEFINQKEKEL